MKMKPNMKNQNKKSNAMDT